MGIACVIGVPASQAAFPGINGRLAYTTSQGDIYTAKYDGTDPLFLTTGNDPEWSPDGTKLAFSRNPGIWIVNADGSNLHEIRESGMWPAWSPDGTKIVFGDEGLPTQNLRLWAMNSDGTNAVRLPTEAETDGGLSRPAWSPDGQHIAYVDTASSGAGIFLINPDGTGRQPVVPIDPLNISMLAPEWLPDSSRIAYTRWFQSDGTGHMLTIRPDGTDEIDLGPGGAAVIAWSPDGTRFATGSAVYTNDFSWSGTNLGDARISSWQRLGVSTQANLAISKVDSPDPVFEGETLEYTIRVRHVTGSQTAVSAVLTDTVPSDLAGLTATTTQGSCSIAGQVVTCQLGDIAPGGAVTVSISGQVVTRGTEIANTATVQATSSDPEPINNRDSERTAVPFGSGYPRPQGASPLRVSLVPAYAQCADPNGTHGPPLSSGSCQPPTHLSPYVTLGTADANARPTSSIGSERITVLVGNPRTHEDEADVAFSVSITDVRSKPGLADYTGQLQAVHTLRITDRLNGSGPYVNPGTSAHTMNVTVPCSATASTSVGATCSIATTADAVIPGAVTEGKRAIWAIDQVTVFDGGSDGVAATAGNVAFAKQGLFIP